MIKVGLKFIKVFVAGPSFYAFYEVVLHGIPFFINFEMLKNSAFEMSFFFQKLVNDAKDIT